MSRGCGREVGGGDGDKFETCGRWEDRENRDKTGQAIVLWCWEQDCQGREDTLQTPEPGTTTGESELAEMMGSCGTKRSSG